jgi:hypothetical protein
MKLGRQKAGTRQRLLPPQSSRPARWHFFGSQGSGAAV